MYCWINFKWETKEADEKTKTLSLWGEFTVPSKFSFLQAKYTPSLPAYLKDMCGHFGCHPLDAFLFVSISSMVLNLLVLKALTMCILFSLVVPLLGIYPYEAFHSLNKNLAIFSKLPIIFLKKKKLGIIINVQEWGIGSILQDSAGIINNEEENLTAWKQSHYIF